MIRGSQADQWRGAPPRGAGMDMEELPVAAATGGTLGEQTPAACLLLHFPQGGKLRISALASREGWTEGSGGVPLGEGSGGASRGLPCWCGSAQLGDWIQSCLKSQTRLSEGG